MLSRQRHLSANQSRRQRNLQVAAGILVLAMVLLAGFYLGHRAAYSGMGLDADTYRAMEQQLPQLESEIRRLEGELEVQLTRHEVDRQSLEMVRQEIASQKEQLATLEEGLRFYRSLMSPGEIAQGLSLRPLELVALDEPGHFAFRIVAQQEARKHNLLKGELSAEVVGVRDGEQVSYPMADLSDDVDGLDVPLRFRYFQSVEGELELPEGFEPKTVNLVARASSPRKAEVRAQFPWQIQERFTHVGK